MTAWGKHVGTRYEGEYRIPLYKIDEFYVEAGIMQNIGLRKFVPFDDKENLARFFRIDLN